VLVEMDEGIRHVGLASRASSDHADRRRDAAAGMTAM
jgi:hypothetical protein